MYNITTDIDREITALHEERDRLILYWFEMGELDYEIGLPPNNLENQWYVLGYEDRKYQLEIGFNPEPPSFDHF
ncbi:MAG: hypothetical protein ACIWVG_24295 [Gloeotrichia echinulata HAB0833]